MDDEKQVGVERQDNSLADAADAANNLSLNGVDRRIDRAQNEGAVECEALEAVPDNVARQRFDVNDDVRELGNITFSAS